MRSIVRNVVLAATSALALIIALPAHACGGDCEHCPRHAAAKTDGKAAAPAPANGPLDAPATASESKCKCEKGGKGCICPPGKCDCENCGKAKKGA